MPNVQLRILRAASPWLHAQHVLDHDPLLHLPRHRPLWHLLACSAYQLTKFDDSLIWQFAWGRAGVYGTG